MPRVIKTIKDDNGNDVEVYSDTCTVCSGEVIVTKTIADELEKLFPFLKQKMAKENPCIECTVEMHKKGIALFSQEEIEQIKTTVSKLNKDAK